MKILAIICEFNPLHNGHEYLIRRAREESGADAVLCIMSGCFTQRGEMCRNDKYTRAKHAILSGADAVIELPAPFAVAPAEIFARGAIKMLTAIPQVSALAFGYECGNKQDFINAARILNEESEIFRATLENSLNSGESYIKSYCAAFSACGADGQFISSPNNILAVEYVKALFNSSETVDILPIQRIGADFNDGQLYGNFSSASGIRANAENPAVKENMPFHSYADFTSVKDNSGRFERLAADWLYLCDKDNLKRVYGCTEGLENRLKALSFGNSFDKIVELGATKRYSKARIRRILTANLLNLYSDEAEKMLSVDLPLKILAVKRERANELLPLLSNQIANNEWAEKCTQLTSRAYALWRHLSSPLIHDNPDEKMILI